MEEILGREGTHGTTMQIYSPPRVNAIAAMWGLLPGWSIDFTIDDPDDGKPWDFNCQQKRDKAERMVKDKKGLLIIGSPLCSASGQLGTLNKGKTTGWEKRNLNHMRFCAKLYKMQVEQGMYFLHEQPPSVEDADDSTMVNLGKDWRVYTIEGQMKRFVLSLIHI